VTSNVLSLLCGKKGTSGIIIHYACVSAHFPVVTFLRVRESFAIGSHQNKLITAFVIRILSLAAMAVF
jgi:hypothetical protein